MLLTIIYSASLLLCLLSLLLTLTILLSRSMSSCTGQKKQRYRSEQHASLCELEIHRKLEEALRNEQTREQAELNGHASSAMEAYAMTDEYKQKQANLEKLIQEANPGVPRRVLMKQFLTLSLLLLVPPTLNSCRAGGIGNSSSSSTASNEVDNSQDGVLDCQQVCELDADRSGEDIFVVTEVCNDEVVEGPDFFTSSSAPPVCLPLLESVAVVENTL